jgi:hypothetical protein
MSSYLRIAFRWSLPAVAIVVLAAAVYAQPAIDNRARIYDLVLGTPVSELPPQYLDPHCGTNGGPRSTRIATWADFANCPAEPGTGLHEVWFSEDDEAEYVALAYRTQMFGPGPNAANVFLGHKVIFSVLIDDAGLIQGYRVFTDPREPEAFRLTAEAVGDAMMGIYGYGNFTCVDNPPLPGETPVEGRYLNRVCTATVGGQRITVERHLFRKPGQTQFDPFTGRETTNFFDGSSRLEVIAAHLVAP